MSQNKFPAFTLKDWQATRDTLHHQARSVGLVRRALTPRLRHWSHTSLYVTATGLTTTPIPYASSAFEIALDYVTHRVIITQSNGAAWHARLRGQTVTEFYQELKRGLAALQIESDAAKPDYPEGAAVYDPAAVETFFSTLSQIDLLLKQFKGELHQETSPVQLWTHHFDLAMSWFSGRRVPDADSNDEEEGDELMTFGFSTGDEGIPDAYFYITAYPLPNGLMDSALLKGAYWHTEGWKGAVLPYAALVSRSEPDLLLLDFWRAVQARGAALIK